MKRPHFKMIGKVFTHFECLKVFKFLYNIVEPGKQVFCMSFFSAHRPNFFNLFSYKSEKAKNTSRVSRKTTCT